MHHETKSLVAGGPADYEGYISLRVVLDPQVKELSALPESYYPARLARYYRSSGSDEPTAGGEVATRLVLVIDGIHYTLASTDSSSSGA